MFEKMSCLFGRKDRDTHLVDHAPVTVAPAQTATPIADLPAAVPATYCIEHDDRVIAALGTDGLDFSRRLDVVQRIEASKFNCILDALIQNTHYEDQRVYMEYHRRRFLELFNHAAELIANTEKPMVLEFGVGEHTRLYKTLFPGIQLHAADAGRYGMDGLGVDKSYILDLTLRASRDAAQIPQGSFDLVLFAEVIEHLLANPVEVIEWLLTLVKPGGHLLLTTPNMFAKANIPAFLGYDNPLPPFPKEEDRVTNAAHLREYSHIELLRFTEQAGGRSKALIFSSCWDDDQTLAPIERKNLIVVIAPGGAP